MTVVAYRDGVLASDSLETGDRGSRLSTTNKIYRAKSGWLIAGCGWAIDTSAAQDWLDAGMVGIPSLQCPGEFGALIVDPNGALLILDGNARPRPVNAEFYAIGIGREYAMGAMSCGADARRAVEVAIEHCTWLGGPIQVERARKNPCTICGAVTRNHCWADIARPSIYPRVCLYA